MFGFKIFMKIQAITNFYNNKNSCNTANNDQYSPVLKNDVFVSFCGINAECKAKTLVSYINSLKDFKINTEIDGNYKHIGATLTDTVLQAGLKYETIVKPKVMQMLKCEKATTVKGLLKMTENGNDELKNVIFWKDDRKPNLIISLAKIFDSEGINTESELKEWLKKEENPQKLRSIKGIGPKTIDYIQILVGIKSCAVDRHLFNFLGMAKVPLESGNYEAQYKEAKQIVEASAKLMKIDTSVFDYSIWSYMSNKK